MQKHVLTKKHMLLAVAISASVSAGMAAGKVPNLTHNMVYELRFPHLEDKCMDVANAGTWDGTKIQLWPCNSTAAQRFKVMALDATYFQLVSINSGRCVDVTSAGTSDGTKIQLWACNGSDAQAFKIEAFADGYFDFPNKGSGRCLDVNAGSSSDGTNLQIWNCNQSTAQRIRAVPAYADTMIESFNSTYLVQKDGLTYYRESLKNSGVDYFWRQALSILALEDAQIRLSSAAYRDKIAALLHTFNFHNGRDWTWNEYNDDLAWAGLAFIRGQQITGNSDFFQKAKDAFDFAYGRGWTNELGGGVWWDKGRSQKEALSNNPMAILGCYLYQSSGNAWYRDKAVGIYNWVRSKLYSTTTGAVYQGIRPNGELIADVSAYNVGTFIEAANCLQKITGQRSPYYDDALRAIGYVKKNMTEDGILAPLGSSEFARGLGAFVRDNKLQNTYGAWMQQNSQAVWENQRSDFGISWNNWSEKSPTDVDIPSLDAKDGVTMLQVAPL